MTFRLRSRRSTAASTSLTGEATAAVSALKAVPGDAVILSFPSPITMRSAHELREVFATLAPDIALVIARDADSTCVYHPDNRQPEKTGVKEPQDSEQLTALRRTLTAAAHGWFAEAGEFGRIRAAHRTPAESSAYTGCVMAGNYAYTLAAVLGAARRAHGPAIAADLTRLASSLLENGDSAGLNADVEPDGGTPAASASLSGTAAELLTLRELRAAASRFTLAWAELLPALARQLAHGLSCPAAEAAAGLCAALGDDATAGAIISAHAAHDDPYDAAAHAGRGEPAETSL